MLHGSGREDIDVRMLGRGRPFVMEFTNPKKAISCHQAVKEAAELCQSDLVTINSAKIINSNFFDDFKAAIEEKAKSYSAVVWVQKAITK
jgi:tRNA pseudouridine synthase 10